MKYILVILALVFAVNVYADDYINKTDKSASISTTVIKPLKFTTTLQPNPGLFPTVVKGTKRDLEPDRLYYTFLAEKEYGKSVYMSFSFAPYPQKGVKLQGSWAWQDQDWKGDTDLDDLQDKNWIPNTGTLDWEVGDPATLHFFLRLEIIDATGTDGLGAGVTTGLATFPVTVSGYYRGL